jgi:hypothetical protein
MRSFISRRLLRLSALILVALLSLAAPVATLTPTHSHTVAETEQPDNIAWD